MTPRVLINKIITDYTYYRLKQLMQWFCKRFSTSYSICDTYRVDLLTLGGNTNISTKVPQKLVFLPLTQYDLVLTCFVFTLQVFHVPLKDFPGRSFTLYV